jgi:hypothetical protein
VCFSPEVDVATGLAIAVVGIDAVLRGPVVVTVGGHYIA